MWQLDMSDYNENLGYCKDNTHHYYQDAKSAFNNLNTHQRELFSSNSAYASEKARLVAWATANNESLNQNNILSAYHIEKITTDNSVVLVISIFVSLLSIFTIGYFVINKKKTYISK